jgi:quinol monooxygenase YgiN
VVDHDPDLEPVSRLLPERVGLFVRLQARPGGRAAVLDALHTYVDRLGEEPGTEGFVVSVDPTDGDMVWLHEWFRDEQALDDHRRSEAFAELVTTIADRLAAPAGLLRVDPLRLHVSAELSASLRSEVPS